MGVTTWQELDLSYPVLSTIKGLGFKTLTPVQASCIPLFLSKTKDVAVEAVTGSGKTLAFLIPMFERLLKQGPFKKHDVAAIIISPTRELATQTFDICDMFLENIPQFKSILLIGGASVCVDIKNFMDLGANIIVATPGRLADLFSHTNTIKLSACVKTLEMLILDEADRLLDMGFEKTLNTILNYLPKQRQTGLFSATQTTEMTDLIRAGLRNPICISVKEKSSLVAQRTPVALCNFYMICEADKKFSQLLSFLHQEGVVKCMVFFSTCASVDYFSQLVKEMLPHIPVISIHGRMRKKRHEIFLNFKNCERGILLCTDVMARGIDIPDIQWVIQFDPPSSASSFVHRCGRTARIGRTGSALIMLLPNEESFVDFLSVNQKVELNEVKAPAAVDVTSQVKQMATKVREIYEKGLRAFVSYIRFYLKHECTLLFRLKDLDIGKLANGFALLKLPRMPELRSKKIPNFTPTDVNFETIPYLNKNREKQRLIQLEKFKENHILSAAVKRKEKHMKNKKYEGKKQFAIKKRKKAVDEADIEEFARDARLLKKFKKGKISKEEFDEKFAADLQDFDAV